MTSIIQKRVKKREKQQEREKNYTAWSQHLFYFLGIIDSI